MSTDYDNLHCTDDDVVLIALGEAMTTEVTGHLRICAACADRVLDMRSVVEAARSGDADLQQPPRELWRRISDEALGDADPRPSARSASGVDAARSVVPLERRRTRWTVLMASAAAVSGILLGGLATWLVVSWGGGAPETVASAQLVRPDSDAVMGSATLQRTSAGMALAVQAPSLPAPDGGYYEVWMASPDTITMVAVGTINPGESAVFTLPSSMDMAAFPVVDISLEQFDGNTGHSSVSVARAIF